MTMYIKKEVERIIFGTDTKAGRLFDIVLLWTIICSVILVILDSVQKLNIQYGNYLRIAEWTITILFTVEYIARIMVVPKPLKYIFSFYGLVDFLAIFPSYFSLAVTPAQYLVTLRALRLLRIFRILKLSRYLIEAETILNALHASKRKILVFIFAVLNIVIIMGTIMYIVEGESGGFSNIPKSIYWAIVTLTTVGFGDIVPQTALGQFISSILMITGYAIIAVPTGIVTAEMSKQSGKESFIICYNCHENQNPADANYCKKCGVKLK